MDKKTEEFYARLREELITTTPKWPTEYLYKFIVPSDPSKVATVESAFDGLGAVIKTSQSKTGKFTSLSVNVMMPDADSIIEKYISVSGVEGIVSL